VQKTTRKLGEIAEVDVFYFVIGKARKPEQVPIGQVIACDM
jgi:hypothetical protein